MDNRQIGQVSLVGAGPGDPELLTLRAWRRLQAADVVLYDALVDARVLELCRAGCRLVDVGKRPGGRRWRQGEINARLVSEAQAGQRVVRLKGGDPFVFGRGGEEALYLAAHGVGCEVVPGVTAAVAAPAAAGIPVTHRGVSTHFTVITGASGSDTERLAERWSALARAGGTLVFLMPVANLEQISAALLSAGMPVTCPAALVRAATREAQSVLDAPLGVIAERAREAGVRSPATLVVGDVVALRRAILATAPGSERAAVSAVGAAPAWVQP